jgi:hypothetical protein
MPGLVAGVADGDTHRAKFIAAHANFMIDALHHHHAAEDELAWPVLMARAPDRADDIGRLEGQHRVIADAVNRVQCGLAAWAPTADSAMRNQLVAGVEDLARRVAEHLDDEEQHGVPLIEEHLTAQEWRAAVTRGASFLSSHPRLGIVLGGFVLLSATPDEGRHFLRGVPLPPRLLLALLGRRAATSYRRKLYGQPA